MVKTDSNNDGMIILVEDRGENYRNNNNNNNIVNLNMWKII